MATLLIDGDTFVYEAGRAAEVPHDWGDGLWTYHAWEDIALTRLHDLVETVQAKVEADQSVFSLSDYDQPNWRLSVDPEYKRHRQANARRPLLWAFLRDYIQETWPTYVWSGLEGDDVLGVLMTGDEFVQGKRICVSIDKDMKTLPGRHYNYSTGRKFIQTVHEADLFHMIQAVAGDPTDGYGGCPGVGMVRAERWLTDGQVFEAYLHEFTRGARKGEVETRWQQGAEGSMWEVAVSIYESKGLGEEELLRNAQVARILRAPEYNTSTGEVTLWTP